MKTLLAKALLVAAYICDISASICFRVSDALGFAAFRLKEAAGYIAACLVVGSAILGGVIMSLMLVPLWYLGEKRRERKLKNEK